MAIIIDEQEIKLSGGNTNASVVRVDNTVRRELRPSSTSVHRLLLFLQKQGYQHSPQFLGIDEKGREKLGFIDGSCEISPSIWCSEDILTSTALALRTLHDLTAGYRPHPDDTWAFSYHDPSRHEVICHNDVGLYNLVTENNKLRGIIDFDLAGPGPRLRDVAYAAYWLTPLSFHATDMKPFALADQSNGCDRLKLFCESYGVSVDATLFDMLSEVLHFMGNENVMVTLLGVSTAETLKRDGHLRHWKSEAQAFDRNRSDLERAL